MIRESRMAAIRAIIKQRSQTWAKAFPDVNAEWTIGQHNAMQAACGPESGATQHEKADARKVRVRKTGMFKDCKTGGGGTRRASMSTFLGVAWQEAGIVGKATTD